MVQLLDRREDTVVEASLRLDMQPVDLVRAEESWRRYRDRLLRLSAEHSHWDWSMKSSDLVFGPYRCVGIVHKRAVQGLMMVGWSGYKGRSLKHRDEPILYVKYLETAPWNLREFAGDRIRYAGVGTALLREAVLMSMRLGMHGRLGLHSLPQAEKFYDRFMDDLGLDWNMENLRLFELTQEKALKYIADSFVQEEG